VQEEITLCLRLSLDNTQRKLATVQPREIQQSPALPGLLLAFPDRRRSRFLPVRCCQPPRSGGHKLTQVSLLGVYSAIRFSFKEILGVTAQYLLKFDFLHAAGNGSIDSRECAAQTQLLPLELYHLPIFWEKILSLNLTHE